MGQYTPKYFSLKECFPNDWPKDWKYFDDRVLITADKLRETFGPLLCNTNGMTQRGFRSNGSKTSQHRFGRAMDLSSKIISSEDMRKYVIQHKNEFPHITFLEVGISWFHYDNRNDDFKLWSPKVGFVSEEDYLKYGDSIC